MIKDLIADQGKEKDRFIRGCQIFFPETIFLKDGKIDFMTSLDKEFCIQYETKIKLENTLALRTKLSEAVRERRKDQERCGKEQQLQLRWDLQNGDLTKQSSFRLKNLASQDSMKI